MTTKTYNGWRNRATWNTALWLTSEYSIYRSMIEFFREEPITKENARFFCNLLWPCCTTPDGDELADVYWPEIVGMIEESVHNEA